MASEQPLLVSFQSNLPRDDCSSICIYLTLLIPAYLIIKDGPVCDQRLDHWMSLFMISLGMELIAEMSKCWRLLEYMRIELERIAVAIWLLNHMWGHWLVFVSQECDEALWIFVFWAVASVDCVVLLGLVAFCCFILSHEWQRG